MDRTEQVQGIIFKKEDGQIFYLLLLRTKEKGSFWQPVSGGVEKTDMNLIEALYRELREEIVLLRKDVIRLYSNIHKFKVLKHYLTDKPITPITEHVFGVQVNSGFEPNIEQNICLEHYDYKWCKFSDALKLLKWQDNKNGLIKLNKVLTGGQQC